MSVAFNLTQVANQGSSIDPAPLNEIASLNLAQTFEVQDNVESAITEWQYNRADLEVVLIRPDGSFIHSAYSEWRAAMNAHTVFLTTNSKRADINSDFVEDVFDIFEMFTQIDRADQGLPWLSKADVDGDKLLTGGDLCEVIDVVLNQK